mmetsp:Transcript_41453/g.120015  ORF Transcript_41453/g.120015 Transcript_41453/m.120015 type:complete len:261 (-) Transcript_41453:2691-3473(-)
MLTLRFVLEPGTRPPTMLVRGMLAPMFMPAVDCIAVLLRSCWYRPSASWHFSCCAFESVLACSISVRMRVSSSSRSSMCFFIASTFSVSTTCFEVSAASLAASAAFSLTSERFCCTPSMLSSNCLILLVNDFFSLCNCSWIASSSSFRRRSSDACSAAFWDFAMRAPTSLASFFNFCICFFADTSRIRSCARVMAARNNLYTRWSCQRFHAAWILHAEENLRHSLALRRPVMPRRQAWRCTIFALIARNFLFCTKHLLKA